MLSPEGSAVVLGEMLSADGSGSGPGRNAEPWGRQHPRGQDTSWFLIPAPGCGSESPAGDAFT